MDEFLNKQDNELLKKENQALERIYRILKEQRAYIIEYLASHEGTLELDSILITLRNIDHLINQTQANLRPEFLKIIKDASVIGIDHQTEFFNKFFKDKYDEVSINPLYGPIELTVLKTLELNVDTFLTRFNADIRERVKTIIHDGFIHGRPQNEVISNIKENYGVNSNIIKRAVHYVYHSAYNTSNHEVLLDLHKQIPSLKKQWWSMIDKDTTVICDQLHEQIQPIKEAFKYEGSDGTAYWMYPPAVYGGVKPVFHFCRSRSIPYREDFHA